MKLFISETRKRPKKGDGEGEEAPKSTPCPFCSYAVPESELRCPQCKNSLPYCVATGLHVIATDLAVCSSCKFPGFRSELLRMAQGGEDCPMCGNAMDEKLLTSINPRYRKHTTVPCVNRSQITEVAFNVYFAWWLACSC